MPRPSDPTDPTDKDTPMRSLLRRGLPWALAALVLVTALSVGTGGAAPAAAGVVNTALRGSGTHSYRVVAAPIRNDGTGWQVVKNDTHNSTGIKSITTTNDRIEIRFSFKPTAVVSFVVTPDEALAKAGIFAGSSVSLTSAKVVVANYKGGLNPANLTTKKYPLSNLWVYGVFESND